MVLLLFLLLLLVVVFLWFCCCSCRLCWFGGRRSGVLVVVVVVVLLLLLFFAVPRPQLETFYGDFFAVRAYLKQLLDGFNQLSSLFFALYALTLCCADLSINLLV